MPLFHLNQPACLFAHIPKTAGNSIRNVVFDGDYEGPWFGDALPEKWQSLFAFAFVRNPFDRVVSAWKMFTEGTVDDAWQLPEGGRLTLTLEQVLEIGLDDSIAFGHPRFNQVTPNSMTRLKNHILPQTAPYHGLQFIQFIGRFENLADDFATVAKKLNLDDHELPKTNWTKQRSSYREFFSERARDLAEELYQQDLKTFDYSF